MLKMLNTKLSGECQSLNSLSIHLQFPHFTRSLWGWRCQDNRCQKFKLTPENNKTAIGLTTCRMICNENDIGTLWPYPSGSVSVSEELFQVDLNLIEFKTENFKVEPEYWKMAETRFVEMQRKKISSRRSVKSGGNQMTIEIIAESDEMSKSACESKNVRNCINYSD